MRGFSSAVLSLAAMALSSLTTYLTFFDSRYTLTQAMADVSVQIQSGGSAYDGQAQAFFRYFPTLDLILSNRGTRPIVISDVDVYQSASDRKCEPTGEALFKQAFEPQIVEPGTVQALSLEVSLPNIERTSENGAPFDLTGSSEMWCLKWTLFDPNGRRHEPLAEAFSMDISFTAPEGDDRYPSTDIELDFPRQPERLLSRGLF